MTNIASRRSLQPSVRRRNPSSPAARPAGLTIVTPSFEKHLVQFSQMLASLDRFCLDPEFLQLFVIVERVNEAPFTEACGRFPRIAARILLTEDVLADFGVVEKPSAFLKRIGKFTFQTLKKLGALARAETAWSLVLDSESLFHKPFRAEDLLNDYAARKYVFYTKTGPRGPLWRESTGYRVTANCAAALGVAGGDRWYMEYFHWFYETDKLLDLLDNHLSSAFFKTLMDAASGQVDHFENVLYYLYIERLHSGEYDLIDFEEALKAHLPEALADRFRLGDLPFALFGNEYLLNILAPDEVAALQPLFERYRLPFVRLEPPFFSTRYLPELEKLPTFVATISSHHAVWLRKKIAVCISGEFRHLIHRVPEQQLRHLLGFLSGVECDIYLHSWSTPDEALIREVLKPRACLFEPRPSFDALAARIRTPEPKIKPRRDEGSLAMFYGLQQAFALAEPNIDEYDYVLRIRPDLFSELSLKEILVKVSDEGDLLPETVYVPKHFHSKGVNDQLALGPVAQMRAYMKTFNYIERNVEDVFFNPESVLLRHLLESGVRLAVVDVPYALMRHEPLKIGVVHQHFLRQFDVWWSRTDDLPQFEDVTGYFADKLRGMEALMRERLPELMYLRAPATGGGETVIRLHAIDNDPSRQGEAGFNRLGFAVWAPFRIEDGAVSQMVDFEPRQLFAYPIAAGGVTIAEWRMHAGRLVGARLTVPEGEVAYADTGPGARDDAKFWTGSPETFFETPEPPKRRTEAPGRLMAEDRISAGAHLGSPSGGYAVTMNADGEIILLATPGQGASRPVWSSEGRRGRAGHLRMQPDGNLVVYDTQGAPLWASDTDGHPGSHLEVRDDGTLVITNDVEEFWRRPERPPARFPRRRSWLERRVPGRGGRT